MIRKLWNRLRGTQPRFDDELAEEMAFHQEMKQKEFEASGMPADEAWYAARRAFGNPVALAEQSREQWSFRLLREGWQDLRYGLRTALNEPSFSLATVLALTLGIGLNAVVFNVWNTLAWQRWAIRDPQSTIQIFSDRSGRWDGMSWPHYQYLRTHSKTTDGIVAWNGGGALMTYKNATWQASLNVVSDNFLDVIGTGFAAGRGFSRVTNPADPPPEIVLHYDLWQRRFGGDPRVIGEWVDFGGQRLQIVGVTKAGFSGPIPEVRDVWVPLEWQAKLNPGSGWDQPTTCCIEVMARLRPDAPPEVAQAELDTLSTQYARHMGLDASRTLVTRPSLLANPTQRSRTNVGFVAVGTGTLLILLLACANVANLQIARCLSRGREISTRLSLGASTGRVLRQMVAENLVLSAVAGALSLAISNYVPLAIVTRIAPDNVALTFENDWRVALFVVGLVLLTAPLIGVVPAWGAVRNAFAAGLRGEDSHVTGRTRLRTALVGVQVALVMTLLGGASLLARALNASQHISPGFRVEGVAHVNPLLGGTGATDAQAVVELEATAARLRALTMVDAVAHGTAVPFGSYFQAIGVERPGTRDRVMLGYGLASAGFVEVLDLKVLEGRSFTPADEAGGDKVLLTESAARRLWPGESAVGKVLSLTRQSEVVGVLKDFAVRELGSPGGEAWVFASTRGTRFSQLVVRYRGGTDALNAIAKAARSADRNFVPETSSMARLLDDARHSARIAATIASGLSGLALLLAVVGIYGVAAFHVARRIREIGLRMALGASPTRIISLVLRQNLIALAAGSVAGIAGTVGIGALLQSLLYGVQPHDPVALVAALSILVASAALAVWLPTRQATRVDPAVALRHE